MQGQDRELLNELVIESREHLTAIEPDLLTLERGAGASDVEILNRIFRAVHNIKGGFGFFGLENIKGLSHSMENVLDLLRSGRLQMTPELTDALLKGMDLLRLMIRDAEGSEKVSAREVLDRLAPYQGTDAPAEKKVATVAKAAPGKPLPKEALKQAIRGGQWIYTFSLTLTCNAMLGRMAAWKRIGTLIDVLPDPETLPADKGGESAFSVVLASILEPDLISVGVELPAEQIQQVDVSELKKEVADETKKAAATAEARKIMGADKGGEAARADLSGSDTLRVRVNLLNNLMNMAGELVLSRNQLMQSFNLKLSDLLDTGKLLRNVERAVADSLGAAAARYERLLPSEERRAFQETVDKEARRAAAVLGQALTLRMSELTGISAIIQNIDRVTSEIQENIMQTRLQPVSVAFNKFPRVVRDLARDLGKAVRLNLSGAEVELDKSIIEMLSDPLNHIIRNSVDHGIETPDEREELGKKREGEVFLRAYHEGGKVLIEVADDGSGLDPRRIRDKALEKGLISRDEAARMSEKEFFSLIFLPGFSTATTVSNVSGRGVGMDVVKTNIERLGGTVDVESEFGRGTRIKMQLPLTLAIIPSLIVSVEGRRFAIPQVSLDELVRIRAADVAAKIESVQGSDVLRLRGKLLPLVRLSRLLGMDTTFVEPGTGSRVEDRREALAGRRQPEPAAVDDEKRQVRDRRQSSRSSVKIVVLKVAENRFGLIVDEVHDTEEIIVKPLSAYLKKCLCYAGAAIMGDGRVAMILDPMGIGSNAGLKFAELEKESAAEKARHARVHAEEEQEMLTFRNGSSELFAIDLSMVARIEQIEAASIEHVGGKEYLKYDDRSLRLLRLDRFLPVAPPAGNAPASYYVIVPRRVRHPMGILATKMEDVVNARIVIDSHNVVGRGIIGSAILNKKMMILVDIYDLFEAAEPDIYGGADLSVFRGRRALLAEDTPFFRTVEERYLRSFGVEVESVCDGEEAWQKLMGAGARYDVLLTDMEMPSLSGVELTRKVRESARLKGLPVVMLTALQTGKTLEKSAAAGADACEAKLDKEQLRRTLSALLSKRQ
ncbi:MAG: chemotaxis protein CheW [Fibrobacterota bacterium]